jgi:integrase
MRVAIRRAVTLGKLDNNSFANVKKARENPEEKGVLTPDEIQKLIKTPVKKAQYRAVVLLGALCGMRRGEMRGLIWSDISDNMIRLQNNFVSVDGQKKQKRGSKRTIPLIAPVIEILDKLKKTIPNFNPNTFIFASEKCPGKPMGETFFRNAFNKELERIGIPGKWHSRKPCPENYVNEQELRNLTLHGMRHDFVTLNRIVGISDMEIQALAGHKDARMMAQYSHANQVIDFVAMNRKMEMGYTKIKTQPKSGAKAAGGNE